MEDKTVQKRANSEELEDRVGIIAQEILSGTRRIDICKKYAPLYNVAYRQIDDYIAWAKEDIHNYKTPAVPELIKERIQELEQLAMEAKADKQFAVARQCKKDISELQGIHTQRLDITTGGEKLGFNIIVKSSEESEDLNNHI